MIAFASLESALAICYWIELLIFNVRLLPCNTLFSFDSIQAYDNSIRCPCVCSGFPSAGLWLWGCGWSHLTKSEEIWSGLNCLSSPELQASSLFSVCESIKDGACPVLIFLSWSNLPTVTQSFISFFPLSCGIYLATYILSTLSLSNLPYIHVKKKRCKNGRTGVFLGAFLDCGLMSCWPHIQLSNIGPSVIFSLPVFDVVRCNCVPFLTRHGGKTNLFFLVSRCRFTREKI